MPGAIFEVFLGEAFYVDFRPYYKVFVELEHINFGQNPQTKELNFKMRSNFSGEDVSEFLLEMAEEDLVKLGDDEHFKYYSSQIVCPCIGVHQGKPFRMILKVSKNENPYLQIITLYRTSL